MTSPMFRDALVCRRCLVPADAFYEWRDVDGHKLPHAVARADGAMFAFAGLLEGFRGADGEVIRSCVILTTAAAGRIRFLHQRMPVVLEPDAWKLWLGETDGEFSALLRPSAAELRVWPVSPRVNNVMNNDPSLLAPLGTGVM